MKDESFGEKRARINAMRRIGGEYHLGSKGGLRSFYKGQLNKFYKIGIGNKTEFGVTVNQTLIEATNRRLLEISSPFYTLPGEILNETSCN